MEEKETKQAEGEYPLTYHPTEINDRNLRWTNHDHRTLGEIHLNSITEGCQGRVEECNCGAWRLRSEDGEEISPWQPGWTEGVGWEIQPQLRQEESRRATKGIPETQQGYLMAISLAIHHSGTLLKSGSAPREFRADIDAAFEELGEATVFSQDVIQQVYLQTRQRATGT